MIIFRYNFRLLDTFGWNFRHAHFHEENRRTLYKAYGIKFVIIVQGRAGKHCTLYTVHCTKPTGSSSSSYCIEQQVNTVHCTLYKAYGIKFVIIVKGRAGKHCTLYTVHCTLYTVHCTMPTGSSSSSL